MKLTRNIIAILVGAIVSGILMSAGGWILAQSDDTRVLIETTERHDKGIAQTKSEIDRLFACMDRQFTTIQWIMGPIIVFLAGLSSALVGAQAKPILAVLGATPYAVLMTSTGTSPEYGVLLIYLVIAAIAGLVPVLVTRMKSSNQAL